MSAEGKAPYDVPSAGKDCFTWYKVIGDLSSGKVPLFALHGGPGTGHEYMACLEDLTKAHGIPIVLYDQLGCGQSTKLLEKDGDAGFWTVELFEEEVDNLAAHLGIKQFDIIGHSWGGMFGSTYAAKRPPALRKLILMGTPASTELSIAGSSKLTDELPPPFPDVIKKHNANMDFEAPEYKEACLEFYKRYLCRCDPWPQEMFISFGHLEQEPSVYNTMFGPSELACTGNLKGWTAIPEAHKILNSTLLINGEFDEQAAFASQPYFDEIPKVKWVIMPGCSHTAMWEDRKKFMEVVGTFLMSK